MELKDDDMTLDLESNDILVNWLRDNDGDILTIELTQTDDGNPSVIFNNELFSNVLFDVANLSKGPVRPKKCLSCFENSNSIIQPYIVKIWC